MPNPARPKLLFVVTEDWFFCSHFLPMARAALADGFEAAVACRVRDKAALLAAEGLRVIPVEAERGDRGLGPLLRNAAVLRRVLPDGPPASAVPAPPASTPPERLRFAGWQLEVAARRLIGPQGTDVALTGGEFDLLCALARHPGRVLSRDFLLEQTRGREAAPFDRTIDVQVGRLRRKIEADAEDPQLIKSVRGAGYLFVPAVTRG